MSAQFQDHANSFGILLRSVPVEAHSSHNKGEQDHATLRRIYEKTNNFENLFQDIRLSLAVNAVNELPNVDGFIPML
jgi:hypothetical protein